MIRNGISVGSAARNGIDERIDNKIKKDRRVVFIFRIIIFIFIVKLINITEYCKALLLNCVFRHEVLYKQKKPA
ncbi:hypothetical protein DW082_03290 [Alistipes sp. AF48-12]|nr:hypothetical protein DW082_03290 [Alistipes sp. AF48-12]